ncbi:lipoprotein [Streptomyces sp. NRRL WC-3618]|uniref:hypothetical protein n=1 Tax=Streptomyces sp. NRRL WC-3618 TaxID=1519490 RepID=UPI0006AFBD32|nr:hypothetical protein [Streptomyces sp. NRRL WC-3618]KOV59671.1 lipoprotein [Streptomyces sp. NRRL WC-3618]
MRIRATVAAVSGALALSALAVPAAQADVHASGGDSNYRANIAKLLGGGKTAFVTSPVEGGEPYKLNVTFSDFKVAKSITVGATGHLVVPITYKLTHGTEVNIKASDFVSVPVLYRGSGPEAPDVSGVLLAEKPATCTATSTTVANCKAGIDIYPAEGDLTVADAGKVWTGGAAAIALNGQVLDGPTIDPSKIGVAQQMDLGTTTVRRLAKLTLNASPEPVRKDATITVTGRLTRANWDGANYTGYGNQAVKLQFRKGGTNTYTTVKTIRTAANGDLRTTVKATVDGFFRYVSATTTTTSDAYAAPDFIDVR